MSRNALSGFHVMTKPIGPICNLDCTYCFYLEKEKLFPANENFKMQPEVLETYIRSYIEGHNTPEISFAWQGGEPTLLGVEYFREIIRLQQKYAHGKRITNALQTNGTLLDGAWGAFLADNKFLVGLSIDGPRKLHDTYRVDKKQRPTFDLVTRGLRVLKKHGVEFNTLTVVNSRNVQRPTEVYEFLKKHGSGFIQFIPLVERLPNAAATALGLDHATPPLPGETERYPVTDWSVPPKAYGRFLTEIFDLWVKEDVGKVFVQLFDVALGNWMGVGGGLCVFSETCGRALALEHDGEVYSCDHYVYPQFRLGNLMNKSLGDMVNSPEQEKFGNDKRDTLPKFCRECEVRFACHGECPKHRFLTTADGEPGLNYLCSAYRTFFPHVGPAMEVMVGLLKAGRAPSEIMRQPPRPGTLKHSAAVKGKV